MTTRWRHFKCYLLGLVTLLALLDSSMANSSMRPLSGLCLTGCSITDEVIIDFLVLLVVEGGLMIM